MMIIALMLAPCAHGLPAAELAALADLYVECGGASWLYANGTDAVGGGAPWRVSSSGLASGDPCGDGWFGVRCDAKGTHVTQLFPNTRSSGNPLRCELPPSIGNLTELEHLYTSNDASPSALRGSIPHSLGRLRKLKCMYFSHNQLSGAVPSELSELTRLQVFLMRYNKLSGPLPDFSPLTELRNVWFDHNQLSGDLEALGRLPHLTFLKADDNAAVGGPIPPRLCGIDCFAMHTAVQCAPSLPRGCCNISSCGSAPPAPPAPPKSMGECFPQ